MKVVQDIFFTYDSRDLNKISYFHLFCFVKVQKCTRTIDIL